MKLKSGKEVELRPVTFPERMEARNATEVGRKPDGSIVIVNSYKAQMLWVKYGLKNVKGIKYKSTEEDGREYASDETLMKLSDVDLDEIANAVIEENTLGESEKKD